MKVRPLRFDKIEPQICTKHSEDSSEGYSDKLLVELLIEHGFSF